MIDILGQRFGKLVVVSITNQRDRIRRDVIWMCKCDCGKYKAIVSSSLRNGSTKSCGCTAADRAANARSHKLPSKTRNQALDTFWLNVTIGKDDECWPWKDNLQDYGVIGFEGKEFSAHRLAWEISRSRKAGRWYIRHRCDNPGCVNPKHLFRGTQKQNVREAWQRKRMFRRPGQKGEQGSGAKLTWEIVRKIRQRYVPRKITCKMLASEFNVELTTVWCIVSNKTWVEL